MTLAAVSLIVPAATPRSARDPSPRASMTWDHAQVPPAVVPLSTIVIRGCAATHRDRVSELPPRHR
jgi:hypothetical protein